MTILLPWGEKSQYTVVLLTASEALTVNTNINSDPFFLGLKKVNPFFSNSRRTPSVSVCESLMIQYPFGHRQVPSQSVHLALHENTPILLTGISKEEGFSIIS